MFKIHETVDYRHYSNGKSHPIVRVTCNSCGAEHQMIRQNAVKSNRKGQKHCVNCINDTFHRMTHTRIWNIWRGLKNRVRDMTDKNYGGRGITMCSEWQSFTQFYQDMSGTYRDDLTIERIDVNKSYCKENCRWASNMEQQANKRNNRVVTYKGEKIHLAELCRRSGFSKIMLVMRLNRGMNADQAVEDCQRSNYGKSQRPVDIRRREKRMYMTS